MLKKLIWIFSFLFAANVFAAAELNKASYQDLQTIKGIGPGIATRITEERNKGPFKDWNDFIARTKGVGNQSALQFSASGLTIQGKSFEATIGTTKASPAPVAPVAATTQSTAKETKK